MLNQIEIELERRVIIYDYLTKVINEHFVLAPQCEKIRRDDLHKVVGATHWRSKKFVIEKLLSMGVKLGRTDGKRYFRGIAWKKS